MDEINLDDMTDCDISGVADVIFYKDSNKKKYRVMDIKIKDDFENFVDEMLVDVKYKIVNSNEIIIIGLNEKVDVKKENDGMYSVWITKID